MVWMSLESESDVRTLHRICFWTIGQISTRASLQCAPMNFRLWVGIRPLASHSPSKLTLLLLLTQVNYQLYSVLSKLMFFINSVPGGANSVVIGAAVGGSLAGLLAVIILIVLGALLYCCCMKTGNFIWVLHLIAFTQFNPLQIILSAKMLKRIN